MKESVHLLTQERKRASDEEIRHDNCAVAVGGCLSATPVGCLVFPDGASLVAEFVQFRFSRYGVAVSVGYLFVMAAVHCNLKGGDGKKMKIVHFCSGLEKTNGMATVARRFVKEDIAAGYDSLLTNERREISADVDKVCVHGAWLPVLWKVAKQTKKIGAELVVVPHGSYDPVRLSYHRWKKQLVSVWEHRMLLRADKVLATCEAEKRWIEAYEPRVKRVELTDLKRFFRLSGSEKLELEKGRALHVLYLGRRHPLKGVEFLEKAVEEVNTTFEHSNIRTIDLRIVSDHFGEELEQDWEWCDVLCLPTLSENFGLVVAEALERGKLVVTTDGAPAWADLKSEQGIYLKGYRNGSHKARSDMLKGALSCYADGVFCNHRSVAPCVLKM